MLGFGLHAILFCRDTRVGFACPALPAPMLLTGAWPRAAPCFVHKSAPDLILWPGWGAGLTLHSLAFAGTSVLFWWVAGVAFGLNLHSRVALVWASLISCLCFQPTLDKNFALWRVARGNLHPVHVNVADGSFVFACCRCGLRSQHGLARGAGGCKRHRQVHLAQADAGRIGTDGWRGAQPCTRADPSLISAPRWHSFLPPTKQ